VKAVDIADHEVNIKIRLDLLMRKVVVADNANQGLDLPLDRIRSAHHFDASVDPAQEVVAARVFRPDEHARRIATTSRPIPPSGRSSPRRRSPT